MVEGHKQPRMKEKTDTLEKAETEKRIAGHKFPPGRGK